MSARSTPRHDCANTPRTVTITLPADHPIFKPLSGVAYEKAAAALVLLARNARAEEFAPPEHRWLVRACVSATGFRRMEYAHQLEQVGITNLQDIDFGGGA